MTTPATTIFDSDFMQPLPENLRRTEGSSLCLVFDVETTGLFPKRPRAKGFTSPPHTPLEECPHMLQLSYVIFDSHTSTVIDRYNTLVAPPSGVEVTAEITGLTGITAEAAAKGANTKEVLERFSDALKTVEVVIAHNMRFDRKMINVEAARLGLQVVLEVPERDMPPPTGPKQVCTMLLGAEYARSIGNTYRWSKLDVLYTQLYDKPAPEGLHDSRVDTIVCLQCYMYMLHNLPHPPSRRRRVKDKKEPKIEAKPVDLPPTRYGRIRQAPCLLHRC